MGRTKLKSYLVDVRVTVDVSFPVRAESLADALERSKEIDVLDVITVGPEGYNEGEIEVRGVFEPYESIS